jgi:hypothetical protein
VITGASPAKFISNAVKASLDHQPPIPIVFSWLEALPGESSLKVDITTSTSPSKATLINVKSANLNAIMAATGGPSDDDDAFDLT